MSIAAIGLICVAAIAHASWNLFSKQAATSGAATFVWLLAACVTAIYLPVVIVAVVAGHPHLSGMNWLFMVGTGVLESAYFLFLQLGYGLGDLSVVYPIGRGTGALLAALAGIALLGERPTALAIAGIVAIIAGVVAIGMPHRRSGPAGSAGGTAASDSPQPDRRRSIPKAVVFALATGTFVACYTIWDKYAVATLHTPAVLQGYASFPVIVLAFTPFAVRNRRRLATTWRDYRPQVLGAAVLAPLAYMLVLVALSFTAVSVVAPAREVSVLFGVLLGRRLLGEGAVARRLVAAAAIVAGIIAVAVS